MVENDVPIALDSLSYESRAIYKHKVPQKTFFWGGTSYPKLFI